MRNLYKVNWSKKNWSLPRTRSAMLYFRWIADCNALEVWSQSFSSFNQQESWSLNSVSFLQTCAKCIPAVCILRPQHCFLWKHMYPCQPRILLRVSAQPFNCLGPEKGYRRGVGCPFTFLKAFHIVALLRCFLTELPSKTCGLQGNFVPI